MFLLYNFYNGKKISTVHLSLERLTAVFNNCCTILIQNTFYSIAWQVFTLLEFWILLYIH